MPPTINMSSQTDTIDKAKSDLATGNTSSEVEDTKVASANDNILLAQGHAPVLQRTFDLFGSLGLGFSITNSWLSYASCFGQSMLYGGAQATIFSLIVACFVQWFITAGMAEQASAFPSSGGQYHFTYIVAKEKHRNFAAFVVGVLSIIGWLFITCSGISNNVQSIIGIIVFVNPDFVPQQWHSYLIYVGLIFLTLIPIFTIPQRHLSKWTQMCLYLSIAGFIITTIVLATMTTGFNHPSFLLEFNGVSGWPTGVAWILSISNAMYAFASTDAVIHVAEEMQHPGKAIPQVMNLTMLIGIITALPFMIVMMLVVKDIDAVRNSPLPSLELFYQATSSKPATLGLQSLLTILYYSRLTQTAAALPSQWITCGRLTWAFSRDHGLPWSDYWNHISPYYEFPVRTTLLSVGFCLIYGLLYVASTQAFNSIITTAVLGINISYAVPAALVLLGGRENRLPERHFKLGKLGYFCNAWAPLWIAVIAVFISFPNKLPVNAASMNYVSVVLGAIVIILGLGWWAIRKQFHGPAIDWEMLNLNQRDEDE
ncbi:hypothetical protein NPX13_g8679 [Xylaria arbuscula]|uniref:Amino acid permease/ SLC12A domain-containing protein n=1 Tax=Xylaria arbuscula TaxID=114810 RepID=A0A9W8N853_9PEZI|nr:hypothetical protein NPX13_g8679 [Xylaria arbuscula]